MQRKLIIPGIILVAFVSLLSMVVWPATAQAETSQPIVLTDSTPSVDIVITPTDGAQGVVYLQLDGVHVQLLDSAKNEILSMIDKRVQGLAIQIAQGSASATLHLERLPGVSAAQALVTAQAAMPIVNLAAPAPGNTVNTVNTVNNVNPVSKVSGANTVTTAQTVLNGPSAIKVITAPASTVTFATITTADMLSVPLPPQEATVQLVDTAGTVLLTSITGPTINALAFQLAPGQYAFNMTNRDLNVQSQTTLALSLGPATTLTALKQTAAGTGGNTGQAAANGAGCTATVKIASANVRSGPGTAYSVLGAVSRDSALPVGGINRQGGWLLVQTPAGPAWVALSTVSQSGSCGALRSFDIPVQNAVDQQPVVAQQNAAPPASSGASSNGGATGGSHENHDDHHEDRGGSGGGDHGGDD